MEHQKIINLLDHTSNQFFMFRTKNWIEINDQSRGVCNTNIDIRFQTTMLNLVYVIIVMHTYLLKEQ